MKGVYEQPPYPILQDQHTRGRPTGSRTFVLMNLPPILVTMRGLTITPQVIMHKYVHRRPHIRQLFQGILSALDSSRVGHGTQIEPLTKRIPPLSLAARTFSW